MKNIIIALADKNLGPVGVDTEKYIRWALNKHILDTNTYVLETEIEPKQSPIQAMSHPLQRS